MRTKAISTMCPYCHAPDVLMIDATILIDEPVMRACPACWERKMRESLLKDYRYPVCPICGTQEREWKHLNLENDGDTAQVECSGCGVKYVAKINISVTFESEVTP